MEGLCKWSQGNPNTTGMDGQVIIRNDNFSLCKVPTCTSNSPVVMEIMAEESDLSSMAVTHKGVDKGYRGTPMCLPKGMSLKFPAAPESRKAELAIVLAARCICRARRNR